MGDQSQKLIKELEANKREILNLKRELDRSIYRLNETQRITRTGSWSWNVISNEIQWSDMMYELIGYEPDSVVPSYELVLSHVFHEDREVYERELGEAVDKKQDYYLENRMTKTDDSIVKVISRGRCYTNDEDQLVSMAGTVQDINDFSNLNESLNRLEAYSNILSHDIKSPLRTISCFMGLIKLKSADQLEKDSLSYLQLVEDAAKEISEIVDDILSLAFIKSSKLKRESVYLHSLFGSILRDWTAETTQQDLDIILEPMPEIIVADRLKIKRVFQNLINNSINYSDNNRSTRVTISCEVESDFYHFKVADNGIGISEEHAKLIFDPYFRISSKDVMGTGIGLSICHTIVELHEGRIWVEPNIPYGSVFHVEIPIKAEL